jgi:putative oxygen-independent coproporphyrinogen III oxidase
MLPAISMLQVSHAFPGDSVSPTPTAAYIHIPFCRRRCFYCDFPIAVVGDRPPVGSEFGAIAHYIPCLCREIERTKALLPGSHPPLQTLFFGGGTPSLLTVAQLETILRSLDQRFGIAPNAEISMEIDPGTFDQAQLRGYHQAGVNRVSLGVQAFQPHLLAACGRSHTAEDIQRAVDLIQWVGMENYSLDLISGLPHQTLAHWQESLDQAIALQPTHLSCYDLTIEPMTAFGRQFQPGSAPLPSDDHSAQMYRLAQRTLTRAGYHHYEISNYAKPGYACRHNRVYWENRPFYGFGMGATSYVGGDRVGRPRKTREYYAWVEAGGLENGVLGSEPHSEQTQPEQTQPEPQAGRQGDRGERDTELLLDTLMLGLRLAEGLEIQALRQRFGEEAVQKIWQCLQPYAHQGWVQILAADGTQLSPESPRDRHFPLDPHVQPYPVRLCLSDPEGFLFSNVVLVALFDELGAGQE